LASGGTVVGALLEASRTTPIVFTLTVDPVGAGLSRAWRSREATPPVLPSSNLCDLRWSQVELSTGRIHVRRAA
jgi:hypothetical protein